MNKTMLDCIMSRVSVRTYTEEPVADEELEAILKAGMAAPSAWNGQPWRFIVINDRNMLEAVAGVDKYAAEAAKAPVAIVVCGDLSTKYPDGIVDYWTQDVSAASEKILLAAHSLGLGAVWCGIYPLMDRVRKLQSLLNLPDNVIPMNIIPVGHPRQELHPKDKWDRKKIHFNQW